jgi:hypothetical protein
MFTINEISILGDKLVCNVTLQMADKTERVVNVPVKAKTKEEVISAIKAREALEKSTYEAAPLLNAIKVELEISHLAKAME